MSVAKILSDGIVSVSEKRGGRPDLVRSPPIIMVLIALKTNNNLRHKAYIFLIICALYDEWSFGAGQWLPLLIWAGMLDFRYSCKAGSPLADPEHLWSVDTGIFKRIRFIHDPVDRFKNILSIGV